MTRSSHADSRASLPVVADYHDDTAIRWDDPPPEVRKVAATVALLVALGWAVVALIAYLAYLAVTA